MPRHLHAVFMYKGSLNCLQNPGKQMNAKVAIDNPNLLVSKELATFGSFTQCPARLPNRSEEQINDEVPDSRSNGVGGPEYIGQALAHPTVTQVIAPTRK